MGRFTGGAADSRKLASIRESGMEVVYMLLIFVLAAGVMNFLLEGVKADPRFIILPSRSVQNVNETVINTFNLIVGTAGIYLMYRSGREAVRRRMANMYFLLGVTLVIITFLIGLYIVNFKG